MSRQSKFDEMSSYESSPQARWTHEDSIQSAKESILRREPVVLYGPPGTGKSRMTSILIDDLTEEVSVGCVESIQFHQKYSYEDFIEGYRPTPDGFKLQPGVFKQFCEDARSEPEKEHFFVIDEFNRTELSTTLGEVLYLIEDRENRTVSLTEEQFSIPSNVNLIATMNTADRTIAIMDFALRRRFTFVPVWPDYAVMEAWINEIGFDVDEFTVEEYCTAAEVLNGRIIRHAQMNKHMQLGHSLFVPKNVDAVTLDSIARAFRFGIIPQLERYVGFGREDELEQFLGADLTQTVRTGGKVEKEDVANLVQNLLNDERSGGNENDGV